MGRLVNVDIWKEMARRKITFHPDENWNEISLWGFFRYCDIARLLKAGKLKTTMHKSNKILWVTPTCETYLKHIKPIEGEMLKDKIFY